MSDHNGLPTLAHRLTILDAAVRHNDGTHFDIASPGSPLAADDSVLAPLQLSHLVGHCMALTIDMFRAVHSLLLPGESHLVSLPMAAHYPMLRTAAESSALAVWLLAPEDDNERRTRALRARWEDIVQDDQLATAVTEVEDGASRERRKASQNARKENARHVREKKARLRRIAEGAHLELREVQLGLPGFGPIMKDAGRLEGLGSSHSHSQWRLISGMTHPSASRTLAVSKMEELKDRGDGTVNALFTADVDITNMAIEAAFIHFKEATRLARIRGGNDLVEFVLPPGFPLPPRRPAIAVTNS